MCTYSVRGYSKLDIALRYFLSSFSFFLTFYFHFFVSVCGFDVLIQCGSFIDGHVALSSILHLLCSIQPWSFQISTVKVFPNATCICVTVSFLLNLPFLIMFPSLTLCFLEFTISPPLTYQYMTHCLSFGLVLILFFLLLLLFIALLWSFLSSLCFSFFSLHYHLIQMFEICVRDGICLHISLLTVRAAWYCERVLFSCPKLESFKDESLS